MLLNGTIFTTEHEGVIPGLLKRWHHQERKELQAQLKKARDANNKIEIEYWDKRQLVKKINPNSLYGAIQPVVDFLINVLDNPLHYPEELL